MNDTTSINTKKIYEQHWLNLEQIKELKFYK
jgi:hypothetical protein